MKGTDFVAPADRSALEAFLARQDRPDGALSYREAEGYLFAMACSPQVVTPQECIPQILGEEPAGSGAPDRAVRAIRTLKALYYEIVRQVRRGDVQLPPDCELREDPLANLEDDAPVAQWARGFMDGHLWLEEVWDVPLPEDWEQELSVILTTLMFFGWGDMAEDYVATFMGANTLERAAALMVEWFPQAIVEYAEMGLKLEALFGEAGPGEPGEAGRPVELDGADPCPCGSGRRYRTCCGRQVH